jgi:DNA-directed RNA polymerase specialized sigma24 family protein
MKAHAAHKSLKRVEQLCRDAEAGRRAAVADAWNAGATAKEIAVTLEISLAKVYTLLPQGRKA